MTVFELLTLFVCGLVYFYILKKPRNFPPGPWLTFVDELRLRSNNRPRHLRYQDYLLRYGPVVGFQALGKNFTILGDYNTIKEAFRRDELSLRINGFLQYARSRESPGQIPSQSLGIVMANGQLWQDNRRLALRSFRDLGFGKSRAEVVIHKEAEHMIHQFIRSQGTKQLIDGSHFFIYTVNVIWFFLTSKTYEYEDEELLRLVRLVKMNLQSEVSRSILINFPFVLKTFPTATRFESYCETYDSIKSMIKKEIECHKKNLDKTKIRDFIDAYLIALSSDNAPDTLSEHQLTVTGLDFFVGGSDTTTATLQWAVFYMALYPEIQEKVFLELRNYLEEIRLIGMEDKKKLPYTEAVLSEVQRMATVVPLSIAHISGTDVNISGYNIPMGSRVFSSLYSVHYDDAYWKDPHVFRPERFLSEDKRAYVPNERLAPFGIGKRICLGESLARMEVFLFFTALMLRLRFSLPQDEPPPSEERTEGIICSPKPFNVLVYDRQLE